MSNHVDLVHRVNFDNRKNIFDPKYPKFFENSVITQEVYFQTIANCNAIMKTDSQKLLIIRNTIAILTLLQTVFAFAVTVIIIVLCVAEQVSTWLLLLLLVIIPGFLIGAALCIGGYIFAVVQTHYKIVTLMHQFLQDQNAHVYESVGFQLVFEPAHPIKESSKTTSIQISNSSQQYHSSHDDNQFLDSENQKLM